MGTLLNSSITTVTTVETVQITRIDNNIEGGYIATEYLLILDNGEQYQRGAFRIEGYEAVKALYAETDIVMATGLTFEEASSKILYDKLQIHLG